MRGLAFAAALGVLALVGVRLHQADTHLHQRACHWGASSIMVVNGRVSGPVTTGCVKGPK